MSNSSNSQKFIARNRAPRVQIEYELETNGSQRTVELPFVMGVLADLSGQRTDPPAPLYQRRFVDIDVDNFDERLEAMKPRVAFSVENTLTGDGRLPVDLTFRSLDDFAPGAVASRVEGVRELLETRRQLANLMTYMDGRAGAEALLGRLLNDPALLQALATAPKPDAASTDADTYGDRPADVVDDA